MADIVTAIVEVLKADGDISALAEYVFGGELPADMAEVMPRQAIVIKASGGTAFAPGGKAELEQQRFDLIAYGTTPFEAETLRRIAGRIVCAVERQVSAGVLVHWVQSAGGFQSGRDRDAAWPFAFQSFQTLFATNEVA